MQEALNFVWRVRKGENKYFKLTHIEWLDQEYYLVEVFYNSTPKNILS